MQIKCHYFLLFYDFFHWKPDYGTGRKGIIDGKSAKPLKIDIIIIYIRIYKRRACVVGQ